MRNKVKLIRKKRERRFHKAIIKIMNDMASDPAPSEKRRVAMCVAMENWKAYRGVWC